MKIRSITFFLNPASANWKEQLEDAAIHSQCLVEAFKCVGIETQTTRLASPPLKYWIKSMPVDAAIERINMHESMAKRVGFFYFSTGSATPDNDLSMQLIIPILRDTHSFVSCLLEDSTSNVSLSAIRASAHAIHASANLENGFANLRFAALARVSSGTPFFPAAYGKPSVSGFSIAMQAADVAQKCLQRFDDKLQGLNEMIAAFETAASAMQQAMQHCESTKFKFLGFDFSPAPYPDEENSLAAAIEAIGIPQLGLPGSVGCAALIAASLDKGNWKKIGFNGLMLPVLEDAILAHRALERKLTIRDLLLFSTVCGTGLDTVPMPGDISCEQIEAILWDVAVLAQRLGKPLTARLMPLPGKKAGDVVDFDFEFFAEGGVMDIEPARLVKGLKQDIAVNVSTRRVRK